MRVRLAAAALAALFLAAYLPDLGQGFIRDDFTWIRSSRVASVTDGVALFSSSLGFYRPVVALTFASDFAVWGLDPRGYALTNLLLCVAGVVLVFGLARRFGMGAGACLVAAAVWAFNFHGVNMALLWLSGRTALLVTVLTIATAHAVLRGWHLAAAVLCAAALFSKEEAVVLPPLFTAFAALTGDSRRWPAWRQALSRTWLLWLALPVYLWLRSRSGAFWPTDAPWYYQFSFAPSQVFANLLEYADRSTTLAAAVVLVMVTACGWRGARTADGERRALILSALWLPATFALTLFLPVRSSLYALLPSVATALVAGVVASRAARINGARFARVAAALVVVAAAALPVYWTRNNRWSDVGVLSSQVLAALPDLVSRAGDPPRVVFIDDASVEVNLSSVFGSAVTDALVLTLGESWTGEVVAPADPAPKGPAQVVQLRNGRLSAVSAQARR